MTVRDFYDLINQLAPFDTQESFDNSGFLAGDASREIHNVLFALDVTERVIDEAIRLKAELIVTHHPLMFSAIRRITEDDYEGHLIRRLIREDIALISAHTNLDRATGGTNDTLAALFGLTDIVPLDYVRVGNLTVPCTAQTLAEKIADALNTTVRIMGDKEKICTRLGLCSGAGSDFWKEAASVGADAFLSGEIRHHHALAMTYAGLTGFEAGHFATEEPGIFALARTLQKNSSVVEYNLRIYFSESGAYPAPAHP